MRSLDLADVSISARHSAQSREPSACTRCERHLLDRPAHVTLEVPLFPGHADVLAACRDAPAPWPSRDPSGIWVHVERAGRRDPGGSPFLLGDVPRPDPGARVAVRGRCRASVAAVRGALRAVVHGLRRPRGDARSSYSVLFGCHPRQPSRRVPTTPSWVGRQCSTDAGSLFFGARILRTAHAPEPALTTGSDAVAGWSGLRRFLGSTLIRPFAARGFDFNAIYDLSTVCSPNLTAARAQRSLAMFSFHRLDLAPATRDLVVP